MLEEAHAIRKRYGSMKLNPKNGLKVIDVGPPSDNEAEVKVFRAFWGEKSELRRFQRCANL